MFTNNFNNKKGVFKNKDVFTVNHMPRTFEHRDNQLQALAYNTNSIWHGSVPGNLILIGHYATGKTTTAKMFLEAAEQEFENLKTVMVNCQYYDTENKILLEICNKLGKTQIRGGASTLKLIEKLKKLLKDDYLIVCLDEFQHMKEKKELNNILYSLTRAHEYDSDFRISTMCITNYDSDWQFFISDRVQSTFLPTVIQFPRYTSEEIESILSERIDLGFHLGVINNNDFQKIVQKTYNENNIRVGLDLLKKYGEEKEKGII